MTDLTTTLTTLREQHLRYRKRRATTAIDVPSAVWLCETITRERASTILELGSGFSSWVLRYWQQTHPSLVVWTVDDERPWLEKTRAEVKAAGLPTERFLDFDTLLAQSLARCFDIVFVDLDSPDTRVKYADAFVRWTRPGGLLVLDDWQMPHYSIPMTEALARHSLRVDPIPETMDSFGRYLAIARVPDSSTAH